MERRYTIFYSFAIAMTVLSVTVCEVITYYSAHTIRLIEFDTWRVINSCTYLLTYELSTVLDSIV